MYIWAIPLVTIGIRRVIDLESLKIWVTMGIQTLNLKKQNPLVTMGTQAIHPLITMHSGYRS